MTTPQYNCYSRKYVNRVRRLCRPTVYCCFIEFLLCFTFDNITLHFPFKYLRLYYGLIDIVVKNTIKGKAMRVFVLYATRIEHCIKYNLQIVFLLLFTMDEF